MKYLIPLFILLTTLISCEDNDKQNEESTKISKKNDAIFKEISKKWQFTFPESKPEVKASISEWNEWQQIKRELEEKPKTSLLAFQMKVKNVSEKSDSLSLTVPESFNIPQVRSRLVTLNTKIKSLDTYIHLEDIPQKRVITLINEINEEIKGVYTQMDEIVIKKAIPKEIGEEIMIRALDTTRLARKKFQDEIIENKDQQKSEETEE